MQLGEAILSILFKMRGHLCLPTHTMYAPVPVRDMGEFMLVDLLVHRQRFRHLSSRLEPHRSFNLIRYKTRPLFSNIEKLSSSWCSVFRPRLRGLMRFIIRKGIRRTHTFSSTTIDTDPIEISIDSLDHLKLLFSLVLGDNSDARSLFFYQSTNKDLSITTSQRLRVERTLRLSCFLFFFNFPLKLLLLSIFLCIQALVLLEEPR